MRREILLSEALFTKQNTPGYANIAEIDNWERVSLPHTWNNLDGQDGGADYYRGACWYKIDLPEPINGLCQFVQFEGANHVAQVWCNGAFLGEHRGGFSTFRFDITEHMLPEGNQLTVCVDNGKDNHVYPQQADFTFFGGLYRDITFLQIPRAHFDLMKLGSSGVFITPVLEDNCGNIRIDAFPVGISVDAKVCCRILDATGCCIAENETPAVNQTTLELKISEPRLWTGRISPYLYTAQVILLDGGKAVDQVSIPFGIRSFKVDAQTGFYLNQESYPLRGVSRHQDRKNKGWALTSEDHRQDAMLIHEMGANSVRLAHYQHSQCFYDLCDELGFVVWAEIPFISIFDEAPEARENTMTQMRELIAQNYNHPSICFWGISNEISMNGETPALMENLKALDALVKGVDPSRLSTIAHIFVVPMDSEQNQITDVMAYNLYFGWYMGDVNGTGPWLDEFHAKYPDRPLGLSEYGAECVLKWHSEKPRVKDYSEEYQAYYHSKMLEAFESRPYLWGTYVWNMFDFAADSRDEGGCKGMNNKGLVTYDRRTNKDAFYVYKAWWSDLPFVHLAGRRFINRTGEKTCVKAYSNQSEITLLVNGQPFGTSKKGPVFTFEEVPLNRGVNIITVKSGELMDSITLNGVTEPDTTYILPKDEDDDSKNVRNWFDDEVEVKAELSFPEGYYSIKDTLVKLREHPETAAILKESMSGIMGKMPASSKEVSGSAMMANITLEMALQFVSDKMPPNSIANINERLIKIKKPD